MLKRRLTSATCMSLRLSDRNPRAHCAGRAVVRDSAQNAIIRRKKSTSLIVSFSREEILLGSRVRRHHAADQARKLRSGDAILCSFGSRCDLSESSSSSSSLLLLVGILLGSFYLQVADCEAAKSEESSESRKTKEEKDEDGQGEEISGRAFGLDYFVDSYAANERSEDGWEVHVETLPGLAEEHGQGVFFGCYDGHGGAAAVEFVKKKFFKNLQACCLSSSSGEDAIINSFLDTDSQLVAHFLPIFQQGLWTVGSVGACALIAYLTAKKIFIGNCGDCRAVLGVRDKRTGQLRVVQLTVDHNAGYAYEQERLRREFPNDKEIIREMSPDVWYLKGRLQPTRSIGDAYLKDKNFNVAPMPPMFRVPEPYDPPYVSAKPDIQIVDLDDRHEFLILASDGLFDELSNEQIASVVSRCRSQGIKNVSRELRRQALQLVADDMEMTLEELMKIPPGPRREFHDDMTVLFIDLRGRDSRNAEKS